MMSVTEDERVSLHDECEANCQRRWEALSAEAKLVLGLNGQQAKDFVRLLWQKQFYQAVAEAYERELNK